MEAVITYGKFDYSCRNCSEVIVFGPFFYNYITVKMLLFYKIYICKKAAFLQDRFFTPHNKHTYKQTSEKSQKLLAYGTGNPGCHVRSLK